MICTRFTNSLRIENDGTMYPCCAMQGAPRFQSESTMRSSVWYATLSDKFEADIWPNECAECRYREENHLSSLRERVNFYALPNIERHTDFLTVDISFDTICNAACQHCNASHSSLIAKLYKFPASASITSFPPEIDKTRVGVMDIMGGEPAVSLNVSRFLTHDIFEFPNLQEVGLNTNGSRILTNLEPMLDKGIRVRVTMSMDGTDRLFEYNRYPIKWGKFTNTMQHYLSLRDKYPDLFILYANMVISSLSVLSLPAAIDYCASIDVELKANLIEQPSEWRVQNNNVLTRAAKHQLLSSSLSEVAKIWPIIASEELDVTAEFTAHVVKSDKTLGMRFNDYYAEYGVQI